jgi:hypothetical protein
MVSITLPIFYPIISSLGLNGIWVGNHAFTAKARPIEDWEDAAKGFEVILVRTDSLKGQLEKVATISGKERKTKPQWAINDGQYVGWTIAKEQEFARMGLHYLQEIPVVAVPTKCKSRMGQGFALNVGNVILPHTYKGKRGYVCIENFDREGKALMGGKVEGMTDAASTNIDASSCVIAEAAQEIGVPLRGISIIGCALTPLDLLHSNADKRKDHMNSILTTSILAAPVNLKQLDEAIEHPEKFIPGEEKEKIKGIYFYTKCEWDDLLKYGKMRTPDMIPLARQEQMGSPALRPSLESIVVLDTKPKFASNGAISEAYIFPNR